MGRTSGYDARIRPNFKGRVAAKAGGPLRISIRKFEQQTQTSGSVPWKLSSGPVDVDRPLYYYFISDSSVAASHN